jgi:hypothetical protein
LADLLGDVGGFAADITQHENAIMQGIQVEGTSMLTYENVVSVLLGAIEQAGLNIAYTQELLDTHALGRSLSVTCLPDGIEDDNGPEEPPLRAVIGFRWSPEFTVFSLRGADSLDNIERFVDERLYAQTPAGPSMEVAVTFHLPLAPELQHDMALIPAIARTVQELHRSLLDEEDLLRVDSLLSFMPGRAPRVQSMTAVRVWSLDEALYDADLLSVTFDELCAELHAMIELLAVHYAIRSNNGPSSPDSPLGERRYFKPPTA